MVLSWLLNSVHPDIAWSVIYADTATEVWDNLHERFSQGNDSHIYQIRQEIAEHRQDQQFVSIYYTKIKALWDELSSYQTPPCTCGGLKKLVDREENDCVMQFLVGLNESYATVRGSILMISPLPDTHKVHALVLQHERQTEAAAHTTKQQGSTYGRSPSKKNLKCSYCDRQGHGVEDCFYIKGFPLGHKFHGKNVKPRKPTAHNIQANTPASPTSHPNSKTTTFTNEEYKQLMDLLQKDNGNIQPFVNATGIPDTTCYATHSDSSTDLYWIVDSGATHHISH
uniref:Retrotransposon gag domain-containing protein n=1 Tax=Nelumbo nucifera TaxID=4432 RepID=A0A822ZNN3_NELNU|nr:TPA_asm: hypothetical protein HUJ06_016769 [Nelumbo nucifera]